MRTKNILLLLLIASAMIQDQALVASKRSKHYLVETKEKSQGHKQKHGDYGPAIHWSKEIHDTDTSIPTLPESQVKLAWTSDVSMEVVFPDGSTDLIVLSPNETAPCLYNGALKGDHDSLVTVNGCRDQVHPPIIVTIESKKVNGSTVDLTISGDKTYELKKVPGGVWRFPSGGSLPESQVKLAWTSDVSMEVVFPDGSTDLIDLSPSPLAHEGDPCLYRGALKGDDDSLVTVNGCRDEDDITVTIVSEKVNGLVDLTIVGDKTYEIRLPSIPTWGVDDGLAIPKAIPN